MALISKDTRQHKMTYARFNLPTIKTCPGSTPICRQVCYARKSGTRLPNTVPPCRNKNLDVSLTDEFVTQMVKELRTYRKKLFRIHESGDFYYQEYLDKWIEICKQYPSIRFLAFTKSFHLEYSNKPDNMQIVWSIMPDTDLTTVPPGPRAYAGDCPNIPLANKCIGYCDNCGICWY